MKDIWGAMSDPTRREILSMLQKRDMTAGEIAERFEISNATISHHLKILREAELTLPQFMEMEYIKHLGLNSAVMYRFLFLIILIIKFGNVITITFVVKIMTRRKMIFMIL